MKKEFTLLMAFFLLIGVNVNAQELTKKDARNSEVSATRITAVSDVRHKNAVFTSTDCSKSGNANKATIAYYDFNDGIPPDIITTSSHPVYGWTVGENGSSAYFTIPPSPDGSAYAYVNDDAAGNGADLSDVWMKLPALDFSNLTAPKLEYEFFIYFYQGISAVKISTDGNTWTNLVSYTSINNTNYWVPASIDLSSYIGEPTVYIAFYYSDNGIWDYGWAVDNISVIEQEEHDLAVIGIAPASFVMIGSTVTPSVTIKNVGLNTETTWSVSLSSGSYSSTKNGSSLTSNSSTVIVMDSWTPAEGNHTLTATVNLMGDGNSSNDTKTIDIVVGSYLNDAYTTNIFDEYFGSIDLTTGDVSNISWFGSVFPTGEDYNGQSIYRLSEDKTIHTVAPDGSISIVGTLSSFPRPIGLAYDWHQDNGTWYFFDIAEVVDPFYAKLYSLDMNTFTPTFIGTSTTGSFYRGLTMADDGYLYAVSTSNSALTRIDPATGVFTEIGPMGIKTAFGQDICFDREAGILYAQTFDTDTYTAKFGTFNTQTGAFTLIKDYGVTQYGTLVILKNSNITTYPVNFTVTDGSNPIQGAVVTVGNYTLTTNAQGIATRRFVDGSYNYTITKFGYDDYSGSFTVAGDVVNINVTMSSNATNCTFNISNTLSNPLNATVVINLNGSQYTSGTASNGTIVFSLPPASYTYNVVCDGYNNITGQDLNITSAQTVNVEMTETMIEVSGLEVIVEGADVNFSWKHGESHVISYYIDNGNYNSYYQGLNVGYGTIYDLSDYPDASLLLTDFHHSSWGSYGIWDYKIYVIDMTAYEIIYVSDIMQTTGDDKWENDIDLNGITGLGGKQVGIFMEPLSGTDGYSYPNISGDMNGGYTVYSYSNFNFTTFSGNLSHEVGEWLMNLWIFTIYGGKKLAPKATRALQSYEIFLNGESQGTTTDDYWDFIGLAKGEYIAGVRGVYETGTTVTANIDFEIIVDGITNNTNNSIILYPNPTNNYIKVIGENIKSVTVFNNIGKCVAKYEGTNIIDVASYTSGIYMFNVKTTDGNVEIFKVVIQ
ncbi:MAG: T9SS type A sorting domain-containing protein [Bacteroidales bacterium]|jgi:hypothetical protein|nr:T9SS type A sorting domain-containing protein [Bacteroidales bacterium]